MKNTNLSLLFLIAPENDSAKQQCLLVCVNTPYLRYNTL